MATMSPTTLTTVTLILGDLDGRLQRGLRALDSLIDACVRDAVAENAFDHIHSAISHLDSIQHDLHRLHQALQSVERGALAT
jgi:hypothetical protein